MFELAKMAECRRTRKQKILPIFYDVKPSVVRELSGSLKVALFEHEKEVGKGTIIKWKESLKEIGSINGWVSDEYFDGHQGKLVDDIISTVWKELKKSPSQLLLTEISDSTFHKNTDYVLSELRKREVSKVGIYGLGGVGKTTLAMNVYNHISKSLGDIHKVYWITVSHDCNIGLLQSKLAKAIEMHLLHEDDEKLRVAKLSEGLGKIGSFVVFLDDVWSYFRLENLGISDRINNCKIVITSRSLEICRRMCCQKYFKIDPLPESKAWDLFMEKFGNDMKISGELLQIAQLITKECGGLPLAIITMASSMKGVDDICEWRDCLHRLKEANKEGPESMDLEVYPVLKLSYDRLNNRELQKCLLYCAVYPEDYAIERGDLINLFIDVGLIKEASKKKQFDSGHTIVNKLQRVSLLEKDKWYPEERVKMHDLIRDMALRITRSTFMVKSGQSLKEPPDAEEWRSELEVVSLMKNEIEEIPVSPYCPRLSTMLLKRQPIRRIQKCFFEYLVGLEVLDLSYTLIRELPDSVSNLVKLRALILFACSRLIGLPSVAELSLLRRLDLNHTSIEELPEGMENLINLKYADLQFTALKKIRAGIFPRLSKLCYFCIHWPEGDVEVLEKGELGCLQKLEMFRVWFRGWNEYTTFAKSLVKPNIYHVNFNKDGSTNRDFLNLLKTVTLVDSSCMPSLQLPEDVEGVCFSAVCFEKGLDEGLFPRDYFGNLDCCKILSHLKSLVVNCCRGIERLLKVSSLQNLRNLEVIIVYGCHILREIIASEDETELVSSKPPSKYGHAITLPKLTHLKLKNLPNLESICKTMLVCGSLQELEIVACPKLKRIPLCLKSMNGQPSAPSSLKHIRIRKQTPDKAKQWWESLEWDVPEYKLALQPFVIFSSYINASNRKQNARRSILS